MGPVLRSGPLAQLRPSRPRIPLGPSVPEDPSRRLHPQHLSSLERLAILVGPRSCHSLRVLSAVGADVDGKDGGKLIPERHGQKIR